MKLPVTQFWDSRLLYIYAILSGYIKADPNKLQEHLNTFINQPSNMDYCSAVLNKLAAEAKIDAADNAVQSADQDWFKDMVRSYLDYFQSNSIFAPTGNSTTLYAQHEARLLNKLGKPEQTREIRGNQSSNSKKFLETLLTFAIKGFIEIKVVTPTDETCQEFVAKVNRTKNVPDSREQVAVTKIDGTQIYIGIEGKEMVPLGNPMRYGGATYNFMHYMQTHTNQMVSILDIQELDGCRSKNDMTELVRSAHFDKQLKKIFFTGTTKAGVRFTPAKSLTGDELKSYKLRLNTNRS
ncbi:MAG TPA: hypothetical protein VJ836_06255 [Candidatus Saccharimonadales bacterium]|nr:hypothetical protein [Candidatus Saccharimonadales bacterium]